MSTGRIIVGIDGSEPSKDALRWAKAQADATDAELVVVSAWSYPTTAYPTLAGYVPLGDLADVQRETRAAIQTVVKETIGDAAVTLLVVEGHPANAIIDASQGASMVVVGCRGHGGFVGALVGSVSQHVVAHATCPVVVIRHAQEPHL
jgi:nucleotide-binding universal stress UspA family protein